MRVWNDKKGALESLPLPRGERGPARRAVPFQAPLPLIEDIPKAPLPWWERGLGRERGGRTMTSLGRALRARSLRDGFAAPSPHLRDKGR